MVAVPPPPDDGVLISLGSLIIAGLGGIFGAAGAALLGAWRAATLVGRLERADSDTKAEVDRLKEDLREQKLKLEAQTRESNERHDANIRELHRLANAMQLIPDKADSLRFQSEVRATIAEVKGDMRVAVDEMKNVIAQAPHVWRQIEAQELQVRRSERRRYKPGGAE